MTTTLSVNNIESLVESAKKTLKSASAVAMPEAWKVLQLAVAEVIQSIEDNSPNLKGADKKTLAIIAGGHTNTASGQYSTVGGGGSNNATASRSTISGGHTNTASGNYSTIPGGFRAKTTRYGEFSHAAGSFGGITTPGDAQHTVLVARQSTTDATANVVLTLNGSTPGASNRLTIPSQTCWSFGIKISAYNSTDNQGAWWTIRGGIRRDNSNGTTLIGSIITENGAESSLSTATATVVADDTNEALEIRVTGVAGKDIRWVAVVDLSQVSWGTP